MTALDKLPAKRRNVRQSGGVMSMRGNTLMASLCVLIASACQRAEPPAAPGATPPEPAAAAVVKTAVTAGMRTVIFEAASPMQLRITAGTDVTPIKDAGGRMHGLTLARDNDGIDINCGCPDGCREGDGTPGGPGCIVGYVPGDPNAQCGGSCSTDNSSCFGCSWSFPTPPSDDPRAGLVRNLAIDGGGVVVDPGTPPPDGPASPPADAAETAR